MSKNTQKKPKDWHHERVDCFEGKKEGFTNSWLRVTLLLMRTFFAWWNDIFLVDKVSPLIEMKQQDCFPDLLDAGLWRHFTTFLKKKKQLYFIHFSRFCFLGNSLVFFLSLPEVKRGLTHHLSHLLVREKFTVYLNRCKEWPVVTLRIMIKRLLQKVQLGSALRKILSQLATLKFVAWQFKREGGSTGNNALQLSVQHGCATSWAKTTENVVYITWPLVARLIFNLELNQHGYQGGIWSKLTFNYPPDPWKVDHTTLLFSNNDGGCKGIVSLTANERQIEVQWPRGQELRETTRSEDKNWCLHSRP